MKRFHKYILVLLLSIGLIPCSYSQKDPKIVKYVIIELQSGKKINGQLVNETDEVLTVKTKNETRSYPKNSIQDYRILDQSGLFSKGIFIEPSGCATEYLHTSSAFTLNDKKFAVHGQLFMTFWNFQFRVNNSMDVSLGMSPVGAPIRISIKKRFEVFGLNIAPKATIGWASWIEKETFLIGGQILITNGDKERNFTFGPGISYVNLQNDKTGILFSTFAGKSRINSRFSIFGEGFYARETEPNQLFGVFYGMVGIHYHSRRKSTWIWGVGLGGMETLIFGQYQSPTRNTNMVPFPMLGYNRSF